MSMFYFVPGVRFQYSFCRKIVSIQVNICDMSLNVSSIEPVHLKTKIIPVVSTTHNPDLELFTLQKSTKLSPSRKKTAHETGYVSPTLFHSQKKDYLRCHIQVPTSSDMQELQTLVFVEAGSMYMNLDPKLYEWFLYFPTQKQSPDNKVISDQIEPNQVKDTETEIPKTEASAEPSAIKPTSQSAENQESIKEVSNPQRMNKKQAKSYTAYSESNTIKTSQKYLRGFSREHSTVKDVADKTEVNRQLLEFISTWSQTLNAALIQVHSEVMHVFVPKRR